MLIWIFVALVGAAAFAVYHLRSSMCVSRPSQIRVISLLIAVFLHVKQILPGQHIPKFACVGTA
jgi:hypothetical protein